MNPSANTGPMLDREVALSRVGGDPELLSEIAQLFLGEYPSQLAALSAAIHSGNASAVERAAHALKGSITTFGAQPAVQAALQIEQAGRASDLSRVSELLSDLESRLQILHAELATL
jgi:HPt (histidine-containing phosphotransfer) domain-containing protein